MVESGGAPAGKPARNGAVLAVACLAQLMVVLDVSIVNVALPSMRDSLGLSPAGLQWVVNAYTVAFAGFLLLGGRFADLFGRRRMFLCGLVLFVAASLFGGFAQNGTWLVVARAVQGLGGAVLAPATLTVVTTGFADPAWRTKAIGVWSATSAAGGAVGSVIGGLLTDAAGWQWVLFVNVPLGAVILLLALGSLTEFAPGRDRGKPDFAGAVTVTAGLAAVILGVTQLEGHAWGSPAVLVPLLAGVLLLAAFAVAETRAPRPIVPLGIFRRGNVGPANLFAALGGAATVAVFYFVSLLLQRVFNYDALQAGLAFLPMSVTIAAGTGISTKLLPARGPKPLLIAGGLVATAGMAWLAQCPADGGFAADLLGPTLAIGLGMGLVMVPITAAATAGIEPAEAGLASGIISTTRQFGGALGLAVLTAVAATTTAGRTGPAAETLTAGYTRAMLVGCALLLAGTLVAFLMPGRARQAAPAEQAPAATE
ncbi:MULTISPECIES: MFS transporter [Amycolatopsis]|uniref:MFS transporter n=2 Tax=Amycolatopsis TaxID=1813 RepID=A0ABW5I4Z8_9PSEU